MTLRLPAHRLANVARAAKKAVKAIGRYKFVHRGPVNWGNFPFDQYDWACAVLIDHSSLLRRRNRCAITLEMWTRMPENVDEVDDDVADQMRDDALSVWEALASYREVDPNYPELPLVMNVETASDMAMEVSDATLKIQGVYATVFVEV